MVCWAFNLNSWFKDSELRSTTLLLRILNVKGGLIERLVTHNLGLRMDSFLHFENYTLQTVPNLFIGCLFYIECVSSHLSTDIRIKLCDSLILSKLTS